MEPREHEAIPANDERTPEDPEERWTTCGEFPKFAYGQFPKLAVHRSLQELFRENGQENGSYHLGFWVEGRSQNLGSILVPLHLRCRNLICNQLQKGPIIFWGHPCFRG